MVGTLLLWAGCTAILIVVLISLWHYRTQRGIHRPLASRQPDRKKRDVPLGYEAIDMRFLNKVNRRNEALERGHTNWSRGRTDVISADTDIDPLADDETYAARYYRAFQRDKTKD